jgi:hypothetical protein
MPDSTFWPRMGAPKHPPADLAEALAMPLRALAGCSVERRCR